MKKYIKHLKIILMLSLHVYSLVKHQMEKRATETNKHCLDWPIQRKLEELEGCRLSNHPVLVGILPILLENPEYTSGIGKNPNFDITLL